MLSECGAEKVRIGRQRGGAWTEKEGGVKEREEGVDGEGKGRERISRVPEL